MLDSRHTPDSLLHSTPRLGLNRFLPSEEANRFFAPFKHKHLGTIRGSREKGPEHQDFNDMPSGEVDLLDRILLASCADTKETLERQRIIGLVAHNPQLLDTLSRAQSQAYRATKVIAYLGEPSDHEREVSQGEGRWPRSPMRH